MIQKLDRCLPKFNVVFITLVFDIVYGSRKCTLVNDLVSLCAIALCEKRSYSTIEHPLEKHAIMCSLLESVGYQGST